MLRWALYDLTGTWLADLDQREGGQVSGGVNRPREAQVSVSFDDAPAMKKLPPIASILRVWQNGWPLFTGKVLRSKRVGSTRTVEIAAKDGASVGLENFAVGMKYAVALAGSPAGRPFSQVDIGQSQQMWNLIQHAEPVGNEAPPIAIMRGAVATPDTLRTRDYEPGQAIWGLIEDMSRVKGGPDFDFEPVEPASGGWYRFNTYLPYKGRDLTASVVFAYRAFEANLADFTHDPPGEEVINRYWLVGQPLENQPAALARSDHPGSQVAHGLMAQWASHPNANFVTTLKELADEVVGALAYPPDVFEMTPAQDDGTGWVRTASAGWLKLDRALGYPPRFGPGPQHDCFEGDLVHVVARDGPALDFDGAGRLTDWRINELPRGQGVVAELTVAPTVSQVGVV